MTRNDFLNRLATLAKTCEFQLNPDLVALYDRGIGKRFGYEAAAKAIEDAIMERRGNERMPSIGDLAQRCAPSLRDEDSAVEVSARVLSAISRFGHPNASDAHRWMGEIGWYLVTINGGWSQLCQTVKEKDLPQWRAQLRDQAAAALRRHKAGVLGAAPKFGELPNSKVAALVGDVIKNRENFDVSDQRVNGAISSAPGNRVEHAEDRLGLGQAV
jgi:hypothetical protein